MRDLLKYHIKKHIKYIILLVVMQSISYIISIYVPYLNGKFVDLLVYNMSRGQLRNYALIISAIGISGIIISYFYSVFCIKTKNKISFELNLKVINHLQKVPLYKYEKYDPTYLNQQVNNDVTVITTFIFDDLFTLIFNSIKLLALIIIFFYINKSIFLITIIFIPIYILVYCALKKPLFDKGLEYRNNQSSFFNKLNEQFVLNREIKTHINFKLSEKVLCNGYDNFFSSLIDYSKLACLFTSLDGVICILFQSIALVVGGIQVINKNMTLGEYTIINVYFSHLLSTIKYYFNIGKTYQDVRVSTKRILDLFNINKEDNGEKKLNNIRELEIKDLCYRNKENYVIINNFNYCFKENNFYAIIGDNGAGKTTLINIICGIIQNNVEGKILYNGYCVDKLDLYNLRKNHISIMLQNEKVPSIKVKDFLYENSEIKSSQGIISLLINKGLSNLFLCEEFNIKNYMEENLTEISGGERQMVILLRTFLKDSYIYILDEPSSNIDLKLTNKIIENIQNRKTNKIFIVITHDSKLVENCDEIIYIN
ncbi:ABC transporter ATP-binding protein [uncultured Clostridium sp.]|uniref:ATP-binding cassette domain-containing protein n=1 Tax=uncultured Clostridium sp. TaxID=59620 RepID=UPI0025840C4D|nr:ABC transporter ATP-binding protein [uncultured Clostridium sp.]MDU1347902.1 ABC transporter ATP-binding protein [Clostridium argentinense]